MKLNRKESILSSTKRVASSTATAIETTVDTIVEGTMFLRDEIKHSRSLNAMENTVELLSTRATLTSELDELCKELGQSADELSKINKYGF